MLRNESCVIGGKGQVSFGEWWQYLVASDKGSP